MKPQIKNMIAVYFLFIIILVLSIIEIIFSQRLKNKYSDYLDIKSIILHKLSGEESFISPLASADIIISYLFIVSSGICISLYAYQNHVKKQYIPYVTITSTVQFILFTIKVICIATWASQNSSQYTPYIQDQSFCTSFSIIVSKLQQQIMCNFVDYWLYYMKIIFPYTLCFIFFYCLFLSILFNSQKFTFNQYNQIKKDENYIDYQHITENLMSSSASRSQSH